MPDNSIPKLSTEEHRKLKQRIDEHIEMQTPLAGNICKICGGDVVKKVTGLFQERFLYSSPECGSCGRAYFYASNVQSVGEEAFRKLLNQPITT